MTGTIRPLQHLVDLYLLDSHHLKNAELDTALDHVVLIEINPGGYQLLLTDP